MSNFSLGLFYRLNGGKEANPKKKILVNPLILFGFHKRTKKKLVYAGRNAYYVEILFYLNFILRNADWLAWGEIMIIDGSAMNSVLDANKATNVESTKNTDPNKANDLGKAGQTTDAGPAVVTSFTAAALESARAVTETSQTADQNRTMEQQNKRVEISSQQQQDRIDVMA